MEYIMEIQNVQKAVKLLEKSPEVGALIPEVRSNIVMATDCAETIEQVVGIPGRITTINGLPKAFMKPDFMSSSHMARLVLNIMKYDPLKKSALNLKYEPILLEICEKLGLIVSSYNRVNEPKEVKEIEGGTIPWGVETAINNAGTIPDVIYHTGAWGKEPMICIIGSNAVEVAEMAVCIAKLFDIRKPPHNSCMTDQFVNKFHEVIFSPSRGSWNKQKEVDSCTFCSIADGNPDIEERVLYNDRENMVLMNIFPYTRGHLEVVPVKHLTDFSEIGEEEVKELFCLVQKSISLIKEVIKPDGVNVGLNLGKAAGASIEHIHIHVVPRFKYESGFMETTADTRIIEENINITYAKFTERLDILRDDHEI